jgi:hypothetical protein
MAVEQMYNAPLRVGDRISSQSVRYRAETGAPRRGYIVTEDIGTATNAASSQAAP